ncbi:DUF4129 domain-containing protein [Bacillus sp. AK031]
MNEDNARDELQDILKSREYTVYERDNQGFFQQLWQDIKDKVIDWLNGLFPDFQVSGGSGGSMVTFALVILGLVALAGILIVVSRNFYNKRKFAHQKPLQHLAQKDWSFTEHLAESEKQENTGDYSLAVRHLFLALLLYFHEKEWLVARQWKTNWEYYEELQKVNQEWAQQFYSLALMFDEAAYGEREISQQEFAAFKEAAMERLEENQQEIEA